MHEVSLLDPSKWKSVEKRTCQVPNSWNQRALWTKFFELIASLMVSNQKNAWIYTHWRMS